MKILNYGRNMGDPITFRDPASYMAFGIRGAGKSTLLEHFALEFLKNRCPIIDLFGSRDGEGLAWLRSPEAKNLKTLLLHGDNTSIASSYESKPISKFSIADLATHDLIISSSPLYVSIDEEYRSVNRVIDEIYRRQVWTRPCFITVREAANLFYSRLKVSADQTIAKNEVVYFIREARHSGFSLGLDSQKLTSIDSDVRVSLDFIFFKSLGIMGLPDEFKWLYSVYQPLRLQKMQNKYFVFLSRAGSHGVGTFPFHGWHKIPGEDLLKNLGIEVDHGEELLPAKVDYRIGDLQHSDIVKMRVEQRLSFKALGEAVKVSHGGAYAHIAAHDKEVKKLGECQRCRRAKGEYAQTLIEATGIGAGNAPA